MRLLFIRFSSIGDIVLTTPVIRCVKQQIPGVEIHFLTKLSMKEVTESNPYIAHFHYLDQDINEVIPTLKKQSFDAVIDLHHNQRTWRIKRALGVKSFSYKKLSINAETSAFIDDMVAAYNWADLVICRAGAMTISEVAAIGVPTILIPLPSAIDDHQTANAHYLTDAGAGLMLMQHDLNAVTLATYITESLGKLQDMSVAAQNCARLDSTTVVANFCIAEARS